MISQSQAHRTGVYHLSRAYLTDITIVDLDITSLEARLCRRRFPFFASTRQVVHSFPRMLLPATASFVPAKTGKHRQSASPIRPPDLTSGARRPCVYEHAVSSCCRLFLRTRYSHIVWLTHSDNVVSRLVTAIEYVCSE